MLAVSTADHLNNIGFWQDQHTLQARAEMSTPNSPPQLFQDTSDPHGLQLYNGSMSRGMDISGSSNPVTSSQQGTLDATQKLMGSLSISTNTHQPTATPRIDAAIARLTAGVDLSNPVPGPMPQTGSPIPPPRPPPYPQPGMAAVPPPRPPPMTSHEMQDPVMSNIRAFSENLRASQSRHADKAGAMAMGISPARLSSVEMMVDTLQRLPRRESAIPHIAPHLSHLDKQGFAALLKMLGKSGMQHRAFEVFDWVMDQVDNNHVPALANLSDCYTYTTIISLAHGSREVCRRGMKYFADMRRRGVPPNVFTYTALMSVCMKANEFETVTDIYEDFCDAGLQPSVVTNKIAVEAYCRQRKWDKAYQSFTKIEAKDAMAVEPRIYVMVIMALGRCQQTPPPADCPSIALRLCEHLRDQSRFPKPVPMAIVYTNMVTVFARVGMVEAAEQFFGLIPPQQLTKSAVSQVALAYKVVGLHDRANMILQQFQSPEQEKKARQYACNDWQGSECFYELLHGECRYNATHFFGVTNHLKNAAGVPNTNDPGSSS